MTSAKERQYMGDDKEFIVQYCMEVVKNEDIDYFIYGHRHLIIEKQIGDHATYFNIGDWINHFSYLEFPAEGCPKIQIFSSNND